MASDLDVSGLATAYRRLVLWFGVQLVWVSVQIGVQPVAGLARTLIDLALVGASLATPVALAYYGYKTAKALGSGVAWLWGVAMLVPLLSLVTILALISKATRACRAQGVPVGFFGPKIPAT